MRKFGRLSPGWLAALGVAAIALITFTAYLPAIHGGFIWDDDDYVTENPLLTAPDGLARIWLSQDSPSQYFPLVYTTFRIEHAIWGLNPLGYHVVNVVLHILSALLIWHILRRLSIPGAWIAAAIFALHPVNVESVAWITERKNTLSMFFYLCTVIAWMRFIDKETPRAWMYYALSLVLGALALFAKSTACTLPAALLLVLWLKGEKIGWKRLAQAAPFAAMGLAMGVLSLWWEQHHQGTAGLEFVFSPMQRILIASRALWFYLWKLVWPSKLAFSYPKWDINPRDPVQYIWPLGCVLVVLALWRWRRQVGRAPIAALAFFAAALAPMLGFFSLYTFRYTFVADHYQYIAGVGPIALFAGLISTKKTASARLHRVRSAVIALLLLLLGLATWRQGYAYKDQESIWRDTIAKYPSSWAAHAALGSLMLKRGSVDPAMDHLRAALLLEPTNVEALNNLAAALASRGRPDEAIPYWQKVLEIAPGDPDATINLGIANEQQGRLKEAAEYYSQLLRMGVYEAPARERLQRVLEEMSAEKR